MRRPLHYPFNDFNKLLSAPDVEDEKRLGGRRRRNSDSFLCFKPHEEDVTLMKLKHAENRWNFERQTFEEENDKLKTEIAEVGTLQRRLFCREKDSGKRLSCY